jgi:hypothetical protein
MRHQRPTDISTWDGLTLSFWSDTAYPVVLTHIQNNCRISTAAEGGKGMVSSISVKVIVAALVAQARPFRSRGGFMTKEIKLLIIGFLFLILGANMEPGYGMDGLMIGIGAICLVIACVRLYHRR